MKRRQFLKTVGIISSFPLISSCKTLLSEKDRNFLDNLYVDEKNRFKIYNQLTEHVRFATYTAKNKTTDKLLETKGYGIVLDKKYITMAHIPDSLENQTYRTPFGMVASHVEVKDKKATLEGRLLKEVFMDTEKDIAIYDILIPQSEKGFEDFPCKPQTKYNLGDEIYLIGNPRLKGTNIRKGTICDLDSYGEHKLSQYCFGIDIQGIGGDSGCPVVNKDFELLGLQRSAAFGGLGYVSKIENFLPHINEKKVRRTIKGI